MVHYEGGVTHLFAEATPRAEDGGEPSSAAWRQRDAEQWSNAEVRSFLKAILPGHSCAGTSFAYMNGKVLSTLSKDDLRQGMRGDEEAVNVIWAELQRQREARQDLAEVEAKGSQPFLLYVRTPRDILVELEVVPSETVAEVKARVAETEGTPVDMQRLTRNGIPMLDGKMLASYGVTHGTRPASETSVRPQPSSQGRAVERHAEGARPPRRQNYISVIFGLLSQSSS